MPHKLKTKLKQTEFYCVSCMSKKKCDPDDIRFKRLRTKKVKGGVPALKCWCYSCDSNLTKFVKRKDAAKLKKKY